MLPVFLFNFFFFYIYIKWWTICKLYITKKQWKVTKNTCERDQNLSEEEKEKNQQYGGELYINLLDLEK